MEPSFEQRIDLVKMLMSESTEAMNVHSRAVLGYANATIRGAFLLNGSAAVAVLAKKETLDAIGAVVVIAGAKGALASVVSSGLSYLAQRAYSSHTGATYRAAIDNIFNERSDAMKINHCWFGHGLSFLAICALITSLAFFTSALADLIPLLGAKTGNPI